jgi:hypothetical protein
MMTDSPSETSDDCEDIVQDVLLVQQFLPYTCVWSHASSAAERSASPFCL